MKNIHLPSSQGGAILSIEFILLAIIGVASAIVVMVAALDIMPPLQDYMHSWVVDFAQTAEHAIVLTCEAVTPDTPAAEACQNEIVNGPSAGLMLN